jgi:hypothetical protein
MRGGDSSIISSSVISSSDPRPGKTPSLISFIRLHLEIILSSKMDEVDEIYNSKDKGESPPIVCT